jgi:hypothetical protein
MHHRRVTMSSNPIAIPSKDRMSPVPADALIAAVCRREFDAIARLLTPDVRMRAVLPTRYLEAVGDEVVAWFTRWFGSTERFEVIDARSANIAGRARVQWRFNVAPHPVTSVPGWHEIEQVAFCETSAGSISQIDLVCSGYRPLPPACVHCDG